GIAVGVVLTAAVYLFTPYVSPAARIAQAENERLRAQLELIDGKLAALTDTIAQLGVRDLQMRALVGLTPDSLSVAAADSATPADATPSAGVAAFLPAGARKPFARSLGFGSDASEKIEELTRRAVALTRSFDAVNDSLTQHLERIANTPSIMPTVGWLSSHFSASRFHPILHEN